MKINEIDKIQLLLMKENFEYRNFFDKYKEALQERINEPHEFWYLHKVEDWLGFKTECVNKFGINPRVFSNDEIDHTYQENLIHLLNPYQDVDELPENYLAEILPFLFFKPAIRQMTPEYAPTEYGFSSFCEFVSIPERNFWSETPINYVSSFGEKGEELKPFCIRGEPKYVELWAVHGLDSWERVLRIDLRRKREQLLQEFETFLNSIDSEKTKPTSIMSYSKKLYQNYYNTWQQDRSRRRLETLRNLRIWQMRRERKSFALIAKEMNISDEVARKGFYRAFELTQKMKYDADFFRRDLRSIKIDEVKKTCDNCPDRTTCNTLCPDVLPFVDQDIVKGYGLIHDPLYKPPEED